MAVQRKHQQNFAHPNCRLHQALSSQLLVVHSLDQLGQNQQEKTCQNLISLIRLASKDSWRIVFLRHQKLCILFLKEVQKDRHRLGL